MSTMQLCRASTGLQQRQAALFAGCSTHPAGQLATTSSASGVLARPRLLPCLASEPPAEWFQTSAVPRGSLANLVSEPLSLAAVQAGLPPGHLALRVHAVGINFRDVLNVLGMYPGDPGAPGSDCAGVVVASRVPGLSVGDEVFGLVHGALGGGLEEEGGWGVVLLLEISPIFPISWHGNGVRWCNHLVHSIHVCGEEGVISIYVCGGGGVRACNHLSFSLFQR